jgi:hypothetical protein
MANSKLTGQTINGLAAAYITDTQELSTTCSLFTPLQPIIIYVQIIAPFTRWLGAKPITEFIVSAQYSNLDLFAFYNAPTRAKTESNY